LVLSIRVARWRRRAEGVHEQFGEPLGGGCGQRLNVVVDCEHSLMLAAITGIQEREVAGNDAIVTPGDVASGRECLEAETVPLPGDVDSVRASGASTLLQNARFRILEGRSIFL